MVRIILNVHTAVLGVHSPVDSVLFNFFLGGRIVEISLALFRIIETEGHLLIRPTDLVYHPCL